MFKDISATEIASRNSAEEKRELSDVDLVINKIVENLGVSGKTLAEIN
jgi:3-hydroxyacyl-CoA dehydrogenase